MGRRRNRAGCYRTVGLPRATARSAHQHGYQAPGTYTVRVGSGNATRLDLREQLWSPEAFAPLAHAAAGAPPAAGKAFAPIYPALIDLTPAAIIAANDTVSQALEEDARNSAAHEAAALTVGAFALREAGRMSDRRWAMNRMTAHLAAAQAFRRTEPGADGRLADALLSVFAGQQVRALGVLDRLGSSAADAPLAAWTRALRMRITEDWRQLPDPPRATRLEKREYFRARRVTGQTTRAAVDLRQLGVENDADWLRLIISNKKGVEDGWLITDAIAFERAEYATVFERLHGRPIGADPIAALNAPATRAAADGHVHVIPWGAWAEFAQRNIADVVARADTFYRLTLGAEHEADAAKVRLAGEWSKLWAFPYGTMSWYTGPHGTEGDTRFLKDAIAQLRTAPHRAPALLWTYIDTATRYERTLRRIPPAQSWFLQPDLRTAYDAAVRINDSGHPRRVEAIERMLTAAPYDYALGSQYLITRFGERQPLAEITRLAGTRMEYDLRPMRTAFAVTTDGDAAVALRERMCEVAVSECAGLGWQLARANRIDDAARVYERAFSDPGLDAVMLANQSEWLVTYYQQRRRDADAVALAERAAKTGSAGGVLTAAHLYERLGRYDRAEELYARVKRAYEDPSGLLGFYYRAVVGRHDAVARALYFVMPTFWPLTDRMALSDSMRVPLSDWRHLESAFAYALLVCACSLFSTIAVLRSKQLT